jgi:hypothetical protein
MRKHVMKALSLGISSGLAAAALVATSATAEIKKYGEAAGWEIAVNEEMGPGCLIEKRGEGWQVQLGVDATSSEKTGYMAVFAKADMPAGAGEALPVDFEVGGETFKEDAFGEKLDMFRRIEGFHGAWVPVNNPDFVYDLAKEETMKVIVEGNDPIEVSLAGTDAAFDAMRECQEAQ